MTLLLNLFICSMVLLVFFNTTNNYFLCSWLIFEVILSVYKKIISTYNYEKNLKRYFIKLIKIFSSPLICHIILIGGRKFQLCGLAQYINLVGVTIGYTITASISMV
jgi:hypothetical protein